MAKFCVMTKMSPADYRSLTMREYMAFITAIADEPVTGLEGMF